eukprot:8305245-Heterocapsa_arctica.AAC.1
MMWDHVGLQCVGPAQKKAGSDAGVDAPRKQVERKSRTPLYGSNVCIFFLLPPIEPSVVNNYYPSKAP